MERGAGERCLCGPQAVPALVKEHKTQDSSFQRSNRGPAPRHEEQPRCPQDAGAKARATLGIGPSGIFARPILHHSHWDLGGGVFLQGFGGFCLFVFYFSIIFILVTKLQVPELNKLLCYLPFYLLSFEVS